MAETAKANRAAEKAAERGTQSNPGETPDEVRYSGEDLVDQAQGLLKVPPHAVVGALVGADQKTFTLAQAKKLVDRFLKREVETDSEGAEES